MGKGGRNVPIYNNFYIVGFRMQIGCPFPLERLKI